MCCHDQGPPRCRQVQKRVGHRVDQCCLTLGSCLAYINWASAGGQQAADYVPVTLLITAVIFALAAAPTGPLIAA